MQWLGAQWEGRLPFGSYGAPIPGRLPNQPTRLQVIAALIYMNVGTAIHGWGVTESGGIYGSLGLDQEGAVALIEAWAFISGMLAATGEAELALLTAAVKAEHDRVAEILEAEQAARAASGAPTAG
jgi:hypothetical protein